MNSALADRLHDPANLKMLAEKREARQREAKILERRNAPIEEEGGIKPLRLAFGSMSLVVGVQLICFVHILTNLFIMGMCTSVGSIKLVGIEIPPWKQVVGATWALIGMPIIIQGGVGALYRIKGPVMNYCFYLLATCMLDVAFLLTLFYEADMCTTVMPSEYVAMGSHFVCGLTDSALFLGFLFGLVIFLYFCFIVWSCAQEIAGWKPALLKKDEPEEYDEEDYEDHIYQGHYPQQQYLRQAPMQIPGVVPPPPGMPGGMPQGGFYGSMANQADLGKGNWKTMGSLPGPMNPEGAGLTISRSYTDPSLQ